jgi:DDE superfamily endonuclease
MPPKCPYLDNEDKAVLIDHIHHGQPIPEAARELNINIKTARSIKEHADKVIILCDENNLPYPSFHDQVKPKEKGRPRHALSELQINTLDAAIGQDRHHRDMLQLDVAHELGLHASKSTVGKAALLLNYHRCKPTKKLDLTDIQMAQRYEIALSRKDWTLADWKRVIFSDEAAILVGEHRGPNKLSRKPWERYDEDCIEVRYNNYSESMFWGCFSYDFKGPCHMYSKETTKDKKRRKQVIDQHNALQMPAIREEWYQKLQLEQWREETTGKKKKGPKTLFSNFVKNHELIEKREKGRGGVDHVRYKDEVLKPLVIPFMQWVEEKRRKHPEKYGTQSFIFQQDNAPAHNSHWCKEYLEQAGIELFEHPGNSPDMNAIEKTWMPMRIAITNVWNRPHTLEWTKRAWKSTWEAITQDQIREYIHHMIEINQRILDDEGGNHFHG